MAMSRRSPFGEFPQVPLALKQNEALDPVDVSSLGANGIMLASDDVSHLIEQFGVCPPAAFSLRCPTCPRFCPSKPKTQAGLDPKFGYLSWDAQNLDRIRVRTYARTANGLPIASFLTHSGSYVREESHRRDTTSNRRCLPPPQWVSV